MQRQWPQPQEPPQHPPPPPDGPAKLGFADRAVHREAGELLEHLRGAALRARHGLVARADELLEVRLALHARVLVDRHAPSVLSGAVDAVERLRRSRAASSGSSRCAPEHEEGLWLASRDPRTWRWLTDRPAADAATSGRRHASRPSRAAAGARDPARDLVPTTEVVGSTRFLALRPEHRSVEIGWTWLHPSAWGTGANVEAKLLQLRHAFEVWGCRRVEFKTDALNERSRGALEALGATFEGIHRKHMLVRDGENRDTAWYSVIDDDWPAFAQHLEARLAEK